MPARGANVFLWRIKWCSLPYTGHAFFRLALIMLGARMGWSECPSDTGWRASDQEVQQSIGPKCRSGCRAQLAAHVSAAVVMGSMKLHWVLYLP